MKILDMKILDMKILEYEKFVGVDKKDFRKRGLRCLLRTRA
jgi:hypothetical protein